ncbi:MAG TPA: hypothetical protein VGC13_20620 [Longimicrobium sp.]|jgi:hypothetical protein|uniref:hypothetical protein n=1 Tax=Longimicrobium sp. TaxID=2029185 RepID=UPI002ED7CD9B
MVSDTQIYKVGDATSVNLQVTYGDAQPGSTTTTWQGDVRSVPLGGRSYDKDGASLVGSILFCKASVKDERTDTNHTCVTYRLTGGLAPKEYYYELTVPDQGAIAEYSINFVFV